MLLSASACSHVTRTVETLFFEDELMAWIENGRKELYMNLLWN